MILIIDNYDSFTYNLVDYVGRISSKTMKVFRHDQITIEQIKNFKPELIIISPGPKTPSEAGITKNVIQQFYQHIPILGVCLGHQAICEIFGGRTIPAKHLMHGKTSKIQYQNSTLFEGLPNPFIAMRYHSLTVDHRSINLNELNITATSEDDQEIMAVEHKKYPLYGVQFHPESILTEQGLEIMNRFLKISKT